MIINLLELIGTFFLGIEAIKLKNFEKFSFNLKGINSVFNPKINWIDENDEKNVTKKNDYNISYFLLGIFMSGGIIYFSFLYFLNFDLLYFIPSDRNYWVFAIKIIIGILIGPLLWTAIIYIFEALIYFLKQLEKYTKTGIIGIIGILIFVITFLLKTFVTE